MFRTILVPLDGSELGESAIPYAEILARKDSGRIVFLRAVPAALASQGEGTDLVSSQVDEAERYLADIVALGAAADVETERLVLEGEPVEAIFQGIDQVAADIVVMSTRGRGGIGRALRGSVADAVLREAVVPVLLVPRYAGVTWWDKGPLRLLLPLDGSALAEKALPLASGVAQCLRASIVLLRTFGYEQEFDIALFFEDRREEAIRYLESVAARLQIAGIESAIEVREARPLNAILDVARQYQVQAIVMATHGHGGATPLVLGSVTERVLHQARLPILVVHPASARKQRELAREPLGSWITPSRA